MRFGIAQLCGMHYHEVIEFYEKNGRAPNRQELDRLRAVCVFYDEKELELDAPLTEASIEIMRTFCAEKTAMGIPHILMTRQEFIRKVLFKAE